MSAEIRASELVERDTFNRYDDENHTIASLDHHGDSVLVVTDDGTEMTLDCDEVVERIGFTS